MLITSIVILVDDGLLRISADSTDPVLSLTLYVCRSNLTVGARVLSYNYYIIIFMKTKQILKENIHCMLSYKPNEYHYHHDHHHYYKNKKLKKD